MRQILLNSSLKECVTSMASAVARQYELPLDAGASCILPLDARNPGTARGFLALQRHSWDIGAGALYAVQQRCLQTIRTAQAHL
jgi:hypothetical protein